METIRFAASEMVSGIKFNNWECFRKEASNKVELLERVKMQGKGKAILGRCALILGNIIGIVTVLPLFYSLIVLMIQGGRRPKTSEENGAAEPREARHEEPAQGEQSQMQPQAAVGKSPLGKDENQIPADEGRKQIPSEEEASRLPLKLAQNTPPSVCVHRPAGVHLTTKPQGQAAVQTIEGLYEQAAAADKFEIHGVKVFCSQNRKSTHTQAMAHVNATNPRFETGWGGINAAYSQVFDWSRSPSFQQAMNDAPNAKTGSVIPVEVDPSSVLGSQCKARYLFLALGPDKRLSEWSQEQAANDALRMTYDNIWLNVQNKNIDSIVLCNISTNIFGFNPAKAAPIAVQSLVDKLDEWEQEGKLGTLKYVWFAQFASESISHYRAALRQAVSERQP